MGKTTSVQTQVARALNGQVEVLSARDHHRHVPKHAHPELTLALEERLRRATLILAHTYATYATFPSVMSNFEQDVQGRFGTVLPAPRLAEEVIRLSELVAQAQNVPRY
ncbi:hypothetical protein [Deinococcus apachensis]|uniref:hypothetical protein n=1 Tax=Deinococcus apachensis TaxID=309886 RepID=UPI00036E71A8|nr:hypothetical protein [Deinococcus apachensis]